MNIKVMQYYKDYSHFIFVYVGNNLSFIIFLTKYFNLQRSNGIVLSSYFFFSSAHYQLYINNNQSLCLYLHQNISFMWNWITV